MRKRRNLTRGQKALRNYSLLALILFGCWAGIRSPLWMMEYELRKDAQQDFAVLWKGSLSGGVYGGVLGTKPMMVAQVDGRLRGIALNQYEGYYWFYSLSVNVPVGQEMPVVVSSRELADYILSYDGGLYLLAAGLPDDAVMGEVTVTTTEGTTYTEFGRRDMDVIWFPVQLESDYTWNELINAAYTLDLYDEDGTLLSRTQGLLHEQKEGAA